MGINPSNRLAVDVSALSLDAYWDEFEHEIVSEPRVIASVADGEMLNVEVRIDMKHWVGPKDTANPQIVTHALAWQVSLESTWTVAPNEVAPMRHCAGREPCSDG